MANPLQRGELRLSHRQLQAHADDPPSDLRDSQVARLREFVDRNGYRLTEQRASLYEPIAEEAVQGIKSIEDQARELKAKGKELTEAIERGELEDEAATRAVAAYVREIKRARAKARELSQREASAWAAVDMDNADFEESMSRRAPALYAQGRNYPPLTVAMLDGKEPFPFR
jgi:hypothetical protein